MKKSVPLLILMVCSALAAAEHDDGLFFEERGREVDGFVALTLKKLEFARKQMIEHFDLAMHDPADRANAAVRDAEVRVRHAVRSNPDGKRP